MKSVQDFIGKINAKNTFTENELKDFKKNLKSLYDKVTTTNDENMQKGYFSLFCNEIFGKNHAFSVNYNSIDMVLHEGLDIKSPISVIFELKRKDSDEMVSVDNLNVKALQELMLYYLRERIYNDQTHVQYLIAIDFNNMFIFPAETFEKNFLNDKNLKKDFELYSKRKLPAVKKTEDFFKHIAKKYIENHKETIDVYHIPLKEMFVEHFDDDKIMSQLYKVFSEEILFSQDIPDDSNKLNRKFYDELLYILGLEEKHKGGKTTIERSCKHPASLIEKTIAVLKDNDLNIAENLKLGTTYDERLFNTALELNILWLNRILFLKLLENQLFKYNSNDDNYKFLSSEKIKVFDDFNTLFFSVFGKDYCDREQNVRALYGHLPYLNSSLFEKSAMEWDSITMANLKDNDGLSLPLMSGSVLQKGKNNSLPLIEYLLKFLNAFDYSSDKTSVMRRDDMLINASVLGLIFEQINGYKDGAVFTPGFITQYICHETIVRRVVDLFNEANNWNCISLKDIYNKIDTEDDVKKANDIINNIKILDPAVGSGHFLVSALNELICIKHKLGILIDKDGKKIKPSDYEITIENDELVVKDGMVIFSYNRENSESSRIQETLFREKRHIIENCLFGVDINPNAVNICRLRLWIELLKNTYYNNSGVLETLPNIDINIKCGNSLLHRYGLDIDVSKVFSKGEVEEYKQNVRNYKETHDKATKRLLEEAIQKLKESFRDQIKKNSPQFKRFVKNKGELEALEAPSLFEPTAAQKKRNAKLKKELQNAIAAYEVQLKLKGFENALEWRFEFPEVLDEEGNFSGFDCVIGNPPYIQLQSIKELSETYNQQGFLTFNKSGDIYCLFVEQGCNLLKKNGILSYILLNKWMKTGYGKSLRSFIIGKRLLNLIDFGDVQLFQGVTTYTCLLFMENATPTNTFNAASLTNCDISMIPILTQHLQTKNFGENTWVISTTEASTLLDKINAKCIPLKDFVNGDAYRGVVTGMTEAFVIDSATRSKIIKDDINANKIIYPVIRGEDIKSYCVVKDDFYLIGTFPSLHIDINNYPSIKNWLLTFGQQRLEQSGNVYKSGGIEIKSRKKTTNQWYETQDSIAYYAQFAKPKIMYQTFQVKPCFIYDESGMFCNNSIWILPTDNKALLGVFNSKMGWWLISKYCSKIRNGYQLIWKYFSLFPIPLIPKEFNDSITMLVDRILAAKKTDPKADTNALEQSIDILVYKLYGLSYDEVLIIDPNISIKECEYNK